jgi:hypothetical protein
MALPRFSTEGDGLQIRSVAANILNKQQGTADGPLILGLGTKN